MLSSVSLLFQFGYLIGLIDFTDFVGFIDFILSFCNLLYFHRCVPKLMVHKKSPMTKGRSYIFCRPWARTIAMSHDAYSCEQFPNATPFPTKRNEGVGNFIGSVIAINNSLPFKAEFQCPQKCRPANHQDWIYC